MSDPDPDSEDLETDPHMRLPDVPSSAPPASRSSLPPPLPRAAPPPLPSSGAPTGKTLSATAMRAITPSSPPPRPSGPPPAAAGLPPARPSGLAGLPPPRAHPARALADVGPRPAAEPTRSAIAAKTDPVAGKAAALEGELPPTVNATAPRTEPPAPKPEPLAPKPEAPAPKPEPLVGTTKPAPAALSASSAPRPSSPPPARSAPDFMIPRPSATPQAPPTGTHPRPGDGDPWRERIAQLEVQLSATRTAAVRASADAQAARERVESYGARIEALDAHVATAVDRVEAKVRAAHDASERPIPLERLEARTAEIDVAATSARAQATALRQELAENKRLDEARAARLASIEGRVGAIEADPRPTELRLAIERVEVRMLAMEREHSEVRARLLEAEARARDEAASFAAAAQEVKRVLARIEELEESVDSLRRETQVDTIVPRLADVEALVLESGRSDARLRKDLEELRAMLGPGRPPSAAPAALPPGKKKGFGIAGLGPKIEAKLRAEGIDGAAALAAVAPEERSRLAKAVGVKLDRLAAWCDAARLA